MEFNSSRLQRGAACTAALYYPAMALDEGVELNRFQGLGFRV